MTALPSPRTWAVGELLTAAKLNTDLRDGLSFLLAPPLAILSASGTASIPNSTTTTLNWTSETIDRDGGHDNVTNPSRYTVQTAGHYELMAAIAWNGPRDCVHLHALRKNASSDILNANIGNYTTTSGSYFPHCIVVARASLIVGDYVEVTVFQNSGSSYSLAGGSSPGMPRFELKWCST